jgi:WD40 repeat protein
VGGIWNTRTRQVVHELDAKGSRFRAAAFTPDGERLVTAGNGDTLVTIWDVETGELESTIDAGKKIYTLATAADNRHVVGGAYEAVVLVDLGVRKVSHRLQRNASFVLSVIFLPDGRHVVSGSDDKTWRIWSLSHEREVARVTGDKHFTQQLAVSPNGKFVATGGGQSYDPTTKTYPTDGDFDIRVWKLPESLWSESRTDLKR